MDSEAFLEKPYYDRQLICFVDTPSNAQTQGTKGAQWTIRDTGIAAMLYMIPVFGIPAAAIYGATRLIRGNAQSVSRPPVKDVIGLPLDLAGMFDLDTVPPQSNVVYVGHRYRPRRYVPLADFHNAMLFDKQDELTTLLIALGARTARTRTGGAASSSIRANVGVGEAGVGEAGIEGGREHSHKHTLGIDFTIEKPNRSPYLPPNLVWFPHEPGWRQIVKLRHDTKHPASQISVVFAYEDDFRINANLALKLEGMGLSLGGEFHKQQDTHWTIEATF